MKGILSTLANFFVDKKYTGSMNIPLLIIILAVLLTALWICIIISKRNRLYINSKNDNKDNAYT